MDGSDLGSDEEWIPGGDVEVDDSYDQDDRQETGAKLSELFGKTKKQPDIEDGSALADKSKATPGVAAEPLEVPQAQPCDFDDDVYEENPIFEQAQFLPIETTVADTFGADESTASLRRELPDGGEDELAIPAPMTRTKTTGVPTALREESMTPQEQTQGRSLAALWEKSPAIDDVGVVTKMFEEERRGGVGSENPSTVLNKIRYKFVQKLEGEDVGYGQIPTAPTSAVSTDESPMSPPPVLSSSKGSGAETPRMSLTDLSIANEKGGELFEIPRPEAAMDVTPALGAATASAVQPTSNPPASPVRRFPDPIPVITSQSSMQASDRSGSGFMSKMSDDQLSLGPASPMNRVRATNSLGIEPASNPHSGRLFTSSGDPRNHASNAPTPEPLQPPVGEDRARSDSIRGADGLSTLPGVVNRGKLNSTKSHKELPQVKYRSGSLRSEVSVDSDGKSSNMSFTTAPVGQRSDSGSVGDFSEEHEGDDNDVPEIDRLSSDGSMPSSVYTQNLLPMVHSPSGLPRTTSNQSSTLVDMQSCSAIPDKSVLSCIVDLLKGTRAQKQKALKRFGQRWIWLGDDLATLAWKSKKQEFGRLSLTEVSRLRSETRELHVENVAGRRVVLVLASREEARVWLTGLSCLVPKKCRVKMDGEVLKERLSYDPLRDRWRGNIVSHQKKVEDYILLGDIDYGYLALSTGDKRFFVVKTIEGQRSAPDAERCAKLLKLSHRNVVRHRDFLWDEWKHVVVLVEEYMARGVVFECRAVPEPRPLADDGVLEIMRDVVRGLEYLHNHGIAHGSIRPDCLFRAGDGSVKISGLTPCFGDDQTMGAFVAPEMYNVPTPYSVSADIWSLGATIYYMVVGKYPFTGPTVEAINYAKISAKLKFPREAKITRKLKDLLERMLVKDPPKRILLADVLRHGWFKERVTQRSLGNLEVTRADIEGAVRKITW